jgi:hypothetical protein
VPLRPDIVVLQDPRRVEEVHIVKSPRNAQDLVEEPLILLITVADGSEAVPK